MATAADTAADTARLADYAAVLLRLSVAYVILVHGLGHFGIGPLGGGGGDVAGFAGFLGSVGIPVPGLFVWVVLAVEIGGGALLLLGLLTRLAAALIAGEIAVALLLVQLRAGYPDAAAGIERDLLLVGGALALVALGAGGLSLDRALFGGSPSRALLGRPAGPDAATGGEE